jgi:hypothetical protein
MSQSAQVHSIDLLERLHDALARFGVDALAALASGASEIHRVNDTLADQLKFWQQQVNKRHEEVGQARAALSHARAIHRGENIGTVEQELALRKAQERVREAEGKVVTIRRWQRELPELCKEFEGPARSLSGFVEADLRQALVLLENKVAALKAYVAITTAAPSGPAGSAEPAPEPTAATESAPGAPEAEKTP